VVSVEISGALEELLDALVAAGIYNSKSEAVRDAVRRLGDVYDLRDVAFRAYVEGGVSFVKAMNIARLGFRETASYFLRRGFAPLLGARERDEVFLPADSLGWGEVVVDLTAFEVYMETRFLEHLLSYDTVKILVPRQMVSYVEQLPLRYGLAYKRLVSMGDRVESVSIPVKGRSRSFTEAELASIHLARRRGVFLLSCDMRVRELARTMSVKTAPATSLVVSLARRGVVDRVFWKRYVREALSIPIFLPWGAGDVADVG